ncbi:DddA-like double-stranded DNA deaminase toxin [Streptomyces sp. NBC_01320]|uniref:DddA-like double-stranded DNA deaminase toxin n=1 Tax=Streptomyces sp. NBC_01320 TaxID=2903824 RepID=UPI003FA3DA12
MKSQIPGPGRWFHEGDNFPGGPGSGRTYATRHVEGNAAGIMQKIGISDADLYINYEGAPARPPASVDTCSTSCYPTKLHSESISRTTEPRRPGNSPEE